MCLFHDWYYPKRERFTETDKRRWFRTEYDVTIEHYKSRYCLKCGWKQNYKDRYELSQMIFWHWALDWENTPELRQQRMSKNRGQLAIEEQERDKLTERAKIAWQKEAEEWEQRNNKILTAAIKMEPDKRWRIPIIPFWIGGPKFDDYYIDRYQKREEQQAGVK